MRSALLLVLIVLLASAAIAQEPPTAVAAAPADKTLHSTLLLPKDTSKPMPVVLLLSGSGPTDRNGNSPMLPGKNNSLLMLAEGLASNGIASLRYDKRGVGESASAMVAEADLRFETRMSTTRWRGASSFARTSASPPSSSPATAKAR